MRLSEGVEWGLHCAVLLAVMPPDTALPTSRLAEFHGVPVAYLAKHLQAMSRAGILVAGTLNHAIVVSLLTFAALHAGAPFGYLHWLAVAGVALAGNLVGGLGLVTVLRLVQVGEERIEEARSEA